MSNYTSDADQWGNDARRKALAAVKRKAASTTAVLLSERPKSFVPRRGRGATEYNLSKVLDYMVSAIRQGFTAAAAWEAAGLNRRSWYRINAKYDRDDPRISAYVAEAIQTIRQAEGERNGVVVRKISTEAANDVKAAQWLAERYMPDDFGARQRLELAKAADATDDQLVEQLYETMMAVDRDNYWRRQLAADLALDYDWITQGQADLLISGDTAV